MLENGSNSGLSEEPGRISQKDEHMSSSPDIDPKELTLPELTDDMKLDGGPVIDTSEEFPLPDFGSDSEVDPDVLFPAEGEPTTEDVRNDSPLPPLDTGDESEDLDLELPSLDDIGKRDWRDEGKPLSELSFPSSDIEFSDDDDYFEPRLELVRQPSSDPEILEAQPPLPPLPGFDPKPAASREAPPEPPQAPKAEPPIPPPAAPSPPPAPVRAKQSEPAKAPPPAPPKESQEERTSGELAKSPVAKYVRKVQVKRKGGKKQAVRPWVPVAGLVLLAVGYFASQPFLADLEGKEIPAAVMIVASQPKGEVFLGEQSLGQTPIALTSEEVASGMEVRREGFETLIVPELGQREDSKPPQKFLLELVPSPVKLSWAGIPDGTSLWWNGVAKKQQELTEVQPGTYQVKAKPADRPAVTVEVALAPGGESSFEVGQALQAEFDKQPTMSVGLAVPEKASAKNLGISVKSLDEKKPFTGSIKVSGDGKASLVVPEAGKYKLTFAGDKVFKPASQTVELASGAAQDVTITLAKQPPPKVEPVSSGGTGGGGYQPPVYRPTYRPTYRPSGGSGGGGRIAPPSF